jgi:hypothetical protein
MEEITRGRSGVPYDKLRGVQNFFLDIWYMGFRAIDRFLGYILLGAAIIVPVLLLICRIHSHFIWQLRTI